MTVAICVYTAQRWPTLRLAIDGTLKQIGFGDELIVVVDHNEELLAQCRKHFDEIATLPNRYSRGLSGARNTAVDDAKGSIVVFLDDDAVPLDGWLEMLRGHYSDNRIYGVGGLAKPHWASGKPRWFPEEFLWVVGCSHRGLPSDSRPVRNPVGANMSFRRSAFEHVGGFVEEMGRVGDQPFGCEDTEFSIRLSQANPDAIIMYEPASRVEHHITEQRASLRYFFRRCWAEGISKAEVTRRVGFSGALSVERHYILRVLPKGVWDGLYDGVTGDLWGTARSLTILAGVVATTAGYCAGIARRPARDHWGVPK